MCPTDARDIRTALKLPGTILSFLFLLTAGSADAQPLLCRELISQEVRQEKLEAEVSAQGIEPEIFVNELEAYRATTTFQPSAWHYAQFFFREQKQISTIQVFFGAPFCDVNELAAFEELLKRHRQEPVLVAVGLDRSVGYAPTAASTRFVEIVSQLHRNTQVRLLIYSYWENTITRSLAELGIPSH